jgi:hypothetical protein
VGHEEKVGGRMTQVQLIAYFTFLAFFNIYWYITYFLAIRRGFIDKTWGIPMMSLTLNLAWDISGSFLFPSPFAQKVANTGFMLCNLFITYQMFRFWRSDFKNLKTWEFFLFWFLAQVASFGIIIVARGEMNDPLLVEVGYVDNFINSALFIAMLYRRENLLGQSIYIAISKFIGTSSVSIMWFIYKWPGTTEATMLFFIAGIAILDIAYILLYYRRAKELGIDVWRRW